MTHDDGPDPGPPDPGPPDPVRADERERQRLAAMVAADRPLLTAMVAADRPLLAALRAEDFGRGPAVVGRIACWSISM